MQETISADKESIERLTKHKQTALLLLGSLEAENDVYKARQMKIQVISQEKSAQFETKGAETMKKHCYKRTDGRWEYKKVQDGFKYYAIAGTYRELIDKIESITPKKIKEVRSRKTNKLTVSSYFEQFYNNYVKPNDVSESTRSEWIRTINNYIKPNFARVELKTVTTEQLQNFVNRIDKENTRGKVFQKIKRVFFKAFVTGKIKRDVTLGFDKPKNKNVKIRTPMTLEEQQRFVDVIKTKDIYTFSIFSLVVGSRREETLKFNLLTDLDEVKKRIHIKGTKTVNADRYVYVSQGFINFLKAHMEKPTFDFHQTTVTKKVRAAFEEANIDKSLHELRHTCSANLYFLGAKDKFRQMQLGHSSIRITNDIYTHIKENIPKSKLLEIYGDLYPRFDDTFDDTFDTN